MITIEKKKYLILVPVILFVVVGFGFYAHAQTVGVTLPSVPAGVTATVVPPSQISISWGGATESSGTIEGYHVYRNGALIATTAGTSIVDGGILSGYYSYTVAAYDANGVTSAQSSPSSVTLTADTTPPTTPTGVTVTGVTSTNSFYATTTLTLSWTASTDNVGVAGYYIYRSTGTQVNVSNEQNLISSTSTAFTGTSVTDTVTPGTYTYTVVAYDAAQNFSNRSAPATVTINVVTTAPSVPTGVSAKQISASGVNLLWATSTGPIGAAGYQVYRDGIQIASATSPSYADTGLSSNIAYTYRIAAYDGAGNISGQSTPISVTLEPTPGPGAPYLSSATFLGTSTVEVSWNPPGYVLPFANYTVYRDGTQVASVTSTDYFDEGLAPGLYTYNVAATDVSGAVSPTSSPLTAIVPVAATASVVASAPTSTSMPMPTVSAVGVTATVVATSSSSGSTAAIPSSVASEISSLTQFLYFGLRTTQVQDLQSLLAEYGYLSSTNATGFFGNLTLGAVQKFQCDKDIVCTGGAGWGTVGPKTRNILNSLSSSLSSSSLSPASSSVTALTAEIQALEAELANLEKQLPAAGQ
jgi:hypothetical protein